jgi:hypothetical protein
MHANTHANQHGELLGQHVGKLAQISDNTKQRKQKNQQAKAGGEQQRKGATRDAS